MTQMLEGQLGLSPQRCHGVEKKKKTLNQLCGCKSVKTLFENANLIFLFVTLQEAELSYTGFAWSN